MSSRSRADLTTAALGGLIGLVAFEAGFGMALANPRNIAWLMYGGDPTVHFLGWHMFRHGPWTSPLGTTLSFVYPLGTSVGLTDSIPILAIVFKLIDPLPGSDFQYIGLWLMAAWVLQGAFAAMLLSTISAQRSIQLLGAGLFVLSPPLLHRFGHAALSAHWLLIASLWMYFAHPADAAPRRTFLKWVVLIAISAATHPYLAAMVLALCAAFYGRVAIAAPRQWLTAAAVPMCVCATLAGLALWQSGYFVVGGREDLAGTGLGFFSLNLLAPLMPYDGSTLFGRGFLTPATAGQYEGYAYAGAGTLFLAVVVVITLAFSRPRLRLDRQSLQHLPFAIVCIGFFLFALSPKITAGSQTILEYPRGLWGPLTVFRSSGRFFWPVYYALVAGLVAVIVRRFRFTWAAGLLAVALALQAVDASTPIRGARQFRLWSWQGPLFNDFWSTAPRHYKHLTLLPTNLCASPNEAIDYTPFALIAGRAGVTLNAGFAARYDAERTAEYCHSFNTQRARGEVSDDELYVIRRDLVEGFAAKARQPVTCMPIDGFGVCVTTRSYRSWQNAR